MSKIVLMAMLAALMAMLAALMAMLAASGTAASAAEVRGVYRLEGKRRLVLTEKNEAAVREGNSFYRYGSWSVERVEGRDRVVVRLRDELAWEAEMDPQVWILDILPDGKGLRPVCHGKDSLEAAVKCLKERGGDLEEAPVFVPAPDEYTDAAAAEVTAAIEKVDAPVRVWREERQRIEARERLKKDPKLLRKVRFTYPEIDPEESVPDGDTQHMLYSPAMRVVFEVLWDTGVKIDKETLESMLKRVDWERGEVLAFWILGRSELDASTLRKYAPKALERIGKTDGFLLNMYFEHKNLPADIKESARRKGWTP